MSESASDRSPSVPIRIGHISDIHFGRIAYPGIVDTLTEDLRTSEIDLVIVSGDLTQRAFPSQYRDAAKFLDRLGIPWLAVPGNHDVFPWWRPILRLRDPLRRFRKWITPELNPHISWPGLAVLGINSSFGWTIQGGRVDDSQRREMDTFFSSVSAHAFRILVVHHHLTQLDALLDHDLADGADATLHSAAVNHVDMILCGHLHISHVAHLEDIRSGRSLIVSTAGTATSDRGRGSERANNFYNKIVVAPGQIEVEERKYDSDRSVFETASTFCYPRNTANLNAAR